MVGTVGLAPGVPAGELSGGGHEPLPQPHLGLLAELVAELARVDHFADQERAQRGLAGDLFFHRGDEAVAAAGNGLDVVGFLGVVAEDSAQLPDRMGEHRFADEGIAPDRFEELLAATDLTRVPGQLRENGRGPRLEAHRAGRSRELVELNVERPFANPQILLAHIAFPLGVRASPSR